MSLGVGIGVSTVLMNSVVATFIADLVQAVPAQVTFSRASSGSYINSAATEVIAGQNVPRLDYDAATKIPYALLIEEQRSNYLLNSDAPATQTVTLVAGSYTLWLKGTGSVAAAAGTAVGTGFGTATASTPVVFSLTAAGTVTFTVSGTVTFVQCENGRWPTSAIHTASSVGTRAADNAVVTDLNSIGFKAGDATIVVEWANSYPTGSANFAGIFALSDGTSNNKIAAVKLNGNDTVRLEITIGGTTTFLNTTNSMSASGVNRLAVRIRGGSYAASLNGGPVASVATAGVPAVSQLTLGRDPIRGYLNGHLRTFAYSSVASADDQLVAATKPQNVAAPVIGVTSGGGYFGSVYGVLSPGLWVGQDGFGFGYQTFADGSAVSGASSASYTLPLASEGKGIAWQLTGTNGAVTQTVMSNTVKQFMPNDTGVATLIWVDSATASTISTGALNIVNQVTDRNAGGYNLTGPATLQPTYVADDGDGKPCINFADGNQLRNTTNSPAQTEDTFFIVLSLGTMSGSFDYIWGRSSGILLSTTAMSWAVGAGGNDGTQATSNADLPVRGKYIVLSGRRAASALRYPALTDGSGGGVMELRENHARIKTTTHSAGSTTGAMLMGRDGSGNATAMKVREAIWFKGYLSNDQMLQVEDYLNNRWNVYPNFAGRRDLSHGSQRYATANNVASVAGLPPAKFLDIIHGQSNAGGEAQIALASLPSVLQGPITDGNIFNPTTNAFETLQVGVNNMPNSPAPNGTVKHGTELSMMYDLAQKYGPSYLVKSSQGGTSLKDWWTPTLPRGQNLWRNMVERVDLATYKHGLATGINLIPRCIVPYQGEADSIANSDYTANYGTREQYMMAMSRQYIKNGSGIRFIVPKVGQMTNQDAGHAQVNAAKLANASIVTNYTLIEGWSTQSPAGGDHGSSPDMVTIGNNIAALLGATTQVS